MNMFIETLMIRNHFTDKEKNLVREVIEFSPHLAQQFAEAIAKQKGLKRETPKSTSPQT